MIQKDPFRPDGCIRQERVLMLTDEHEAVRGKEGALSFLMDLRLLFRSGHCQSEVSGIRKDLVFVGILLLLDGTLDDDRQHQCIHRQREDGDHALGNGVHRGGTDSCIHEAVGVQRGDGGEYAVVLEQGEDLGEHTPGR